MMKIKLLIASLSFLFASYAFGAGTLTNPSAYNISLNATGNTKVTLPASGTLLNSASIGSSVQAWGAPLDQIISGTWSGASSITTLGTIPSLSVGNITATGSLGLTRENPGIPYSAFIYNTDNTDPGSHAGFEAYTGGTSGGDPYNKWSVVGGGKFTMGIDNSDSDKLKITTGDDPSSGTTLFTMTSAGAVTLVNTLSMGSHLINNVTDPVSAQDAATKNYTDTTFLPFSGGTVTGNINTPALINLTQSTYATGTISQSGTAVTFSSSGATSNFSAGWLVPASGTAERVFYTGSSSVMQTSLSQTISAGTSYTLYYSASGGIDQAFPATLGILPNSRVVTFGAGSLGAIQADNFLGSGFFVNGLVVGDSRTSRITTSNPTASQSTTTVTGSGSNFATTDVGRLIMFAGGQNCFITAFTDVTHVTCTPSQTVAAQQYIIAGGTGSTIGATSMGPAGNLGTENAYIHNSLNLPNGTFSVGGNTAFSGAFTFAGTVTGNTAITFPTVGTLATTSQITGTSALTTRMVVHARYVHGATTGVLSAMTIGYVDQGLSYLQGTCSSSSTGCTGFIAPQDATYSFQFSGWDCGPGDNTQEVIDTRGGSTIVYDQKKGSPAGTCLEGSQVPFVVTGVLVGDVLTFKLNENNTGTIVTSITDNTVQSQGDFTASIVQTYP